MDDFNAPLDPHREANHAKTREELLLEVEALRRRVAELEVPARRYRALFESAVLSVQIFDAESRTTDVNAAFCQLWRLPREAVVDKYVILEDPQVRERGVLPYLARGFAGESVTMPLIRYDPQQNELLRAGSARWVGATLQPIKDEAGRVIEAVFMHLDVGEIKQTEDELRKRQEELEGAVEARTQELAASLERLRERQSVLEMSTPVIRLWEGILALPLVGVIDAERATQIMANLLDAIAATRAGQVIVDITGVARVDGEDRIEELARMAGGERVTEVTRQHARSLLERR